ncbi:uncharacterized protein LOC132748683 [Ruditapes philippinarum]|uniref:uncharacterized protein LOC132748683 n=1 Tax=Ruditapes philippinarum TaxID=129788 RepID=UPI00295BF066|nr:uncharacterized protein LOC132748683 [Ruditapes philippinarum]XP_060594289.1 uncharacterized protein LOC132748683 [Ruditapes philippinarum]
MASSAQRGVKFSLLVGLSTTPKVKIKPWQREKIYECIKTVLPLFAKRLDIVENIKFCKVVSITKDKNHDIKLELSVSSLDDFDKLAEYTKPVQQDSKNGLSYAISTFFQEQDILSKCGFYSKLEINISVVMSDTERKKWKKELGKQGLTSENSSDSGGIPSVSAKVCREEDRRGGNAGTSVLSNVSDVKVAQNSIKAVKGNFEQRKTDYPGMAQGKCEQVSDVKVAHNSIKAVKVDFEQRNTDYQGMVQGKGVKDSHVRMTFIVDVPAESNVLYVQIRSQSLMELNTELFYRGNCMYEVTINMPLLTKPSSLYWYEIMFKDYTLYFFKQTREVKSECFLLGESSMHRDMLRGEKSLQAHLLDITTYVGDRDSESDLIMQIEEICRKINYLSNQTIKDVLKNLLKSRRDCSPKFLVRFAFVAGFLCRNIFDVLYNVLDSTLAHEILGALLQKRLSDYPVSCVEYMPSLSKHLFKIGYKANFSAVMFLRRASIFLPEKSMLSALQDCISKKENIFIDEKHCKTDAFDICISFYRKYIETRSESALGIVQCLFQHLPLDIALDIFDHVYQLHLSDYEAYAEVKEYIFTAVTACLKSQILAFSNKSVREKDITTLLKKATVLGKYGLTTSESHIRRTLEDSVITCFSSHFLNISFLQKDVEDFLQYSGCFQDLDTQLLLLKSWSDAKLTDVRKLFVSFSQNKYLNDAYIYLEFDAYKRCLVNEIKMTKLTDEGEIPMAFQKLCNMLKLRVVSEREDVKKALMSVTTDILGRYDLRGMLQHVDKITKLCEGEPTASNLYKEHVQDQLKKRGFDPSEVLYHFCTHGTLRVNTKTTCDIVCTIVDLFFKKFVQEDIFERFLAQIPHASFWELIAGGEGSRIQDVKKNTTFISVISCFKTVAQLLQSKEVNICFLKKMNISDRKTKRILQLGMGRIEKSKIDDIENEFKAVVKNVHDTVNIVQEVLQEVNIRMNDEEKVDLTLVKKEVDVVKERIERGTLSLRECQSMKWLWGELRKLPDICLKVQPIIKSDVLWNVSRRVIFEKFEESLQCGSKLHGLLSIRFLFDNLSEEDDVENLTTIQQTADFLKIIEKDGIQLYINSWENLETNISVSMQSVQEMFENANVPDEIKTVETYINRSIKRTVKTTLTQIWRKNEVIEKAKTMMAVLKAFECDISNDNELNIALKSFNDLIHQEISDFTLQDVQIALDTIFSLADTLDDETVCIMAEIGKSSVLLEFLKEIAVEDVRNLIDAVEDISESHVQESTVSALIEVKRFLLPLLIQEKQLHENGSRWIFKTLKKQTKQFGKNARSIPDKIIDCSLNIHNLKSLYNNVANRGQQTKEIIKSIVTKGRFVFKLRQDGDHVSFEVSYKDNKNSFTKNENTLSDIRSRALLLLNSERESLESNVNQEEFKLFIEYVNICLEIRDILFDLYSSGHIKYTVLKLVLQPNELTETKDRLKKELQDWMSCIYETRNKYYLMNFIQGCQVRVISEFLESGARQNVVEAIMKFIHPCLSAKLLIDTYRSELCLKNETLVLDELGRSLHEIYEGMEIYSRNMESFGNKQTTAKLTECVCKGKILVAQLGENSDFVIRTVLALYRNTTHCMPEPSQLLFCTRETTWNEIDLLLQRCKWAYKFYGLLPLYCIANVELLQNKVQFTLVDELQNLQDTCTEFLLTIVCRGSKNHPFVDKLNNRVATIQPVSNQEIENIFHTSHSNVLTYTSEVPGLGKTSRILNRSVSHSRSTVTVQVSGQAKKSLLVANLLEVKVHSFHTLHFDIGVVDDPSELDTFLFELIILNYVAYGKLAFYMPTNHICVEIGNTINDSLRTNLTTVTAFKREHLLWNNFSDFVCSKEMNSPVQVVCHYLQALDKGVLDSEELCFSKKNHLQPLSDFTCRCLLGKHINVSSDLSFSIVHTFLNVLSDQLKKMSCSAFFKVAHLSEMVGKLTVPMIRSNLVKAMIDVSLEFAARSVNACRSTQSSTLSTGDSYCKEPKSSDLVSKVLHRVDSMIRWEESNHLIYVFHSQNIHTLSPMYRKKENVPAHVQKLFESQMKKSLPDFSSMGQTELQSMLQKVARKKPLPLDKNQLQHFSKDYALTPDNLLKMVLIMMRIQSHVPVVIMGETGCGKTSLIRYLANICDVPFKVMNIHAGVFSSEILHIVRQENAECLESLDQQRWLFLDEINTSENIGLICDIICHHKCSGQSLAPNLVIMGACNPYRLRSVDAIQTAGLAGKVKTDDLSKLVYRVLPLPEMTVDYVWDFGSLSEQDEMKYIKRMVDGVFKTESPEHSLLSDLLSISQTFVRDKEKSTCVVSLRDVERCKTLVPWFINILKQKENTTTRQTDLEINAIILALAHCYHSRFLQKADRKKYREKLLEGFKRSSFSLILKEKDIHDVIKTEQRNIIDRMVIPPGTAKNTALQENIFVILVCILNKIPVFVVGKPGCSKSLAMQIIRSNLRGKDSKDKFFKTLPQLYCVSFQGSESSTSDGIIKVFEKAQNYQKSNSKDSVLSVVILDEIGLAEVSRFNPLKVLHNLLEPEGRSRPDIAVVGISNWALDASKMNRAVHLSRPDMDAEELFETSMSISTSFVESTQVHEGLSLTSTKTSFSQLDIKDELLLVAKAYINYTNKLQFSNFHGLRDFYSLVKFIARKLANTSKGKPLHNKSEVIMEGLLRNFGGLKSGRNALLDHFKECIQNSGPVSFLSVELINSNIVDTMARHLMIVTKGDSVLGILEHNLKQSGREGREIIFGSQFEEDLTDEYSYRILSRIILCMEQGIVLVLKDLENIYGSLYDMLNQNYTRIGKKNNCRVALGPYSNPFCHVAESFGCIVLIDENKVNYSDPPFLNRFEKQVLSFADVMHSQEIKVVEELDRWMEQISQIEGTPFTKYSAMPFYSEELISSLVLYMKRRDEEFNLTFIEKCKEELLWIIRPEVIVRLPVVDDFHIQKSSLQIRSDYFHLPLHKGIGNLIHFQKNTDSNSNMTVVFTNSNIHTNITDELANWNFQREKLGAFKSEKQLSIKLQQFWQSDKQLLLIHCSAQEDDKHVMLTKSLIEKYRSEYIESSKGPAMKFVYLIIHLGSRDVSYFNGESSCLVSQINYLSGWKLLLLESLECPRITLPALCSRTLLETIAVMLPMTDVIQEELFWAFTRIKYGNHGRNAKSINHIIEKMNSCPTFLEIISELIWSYVQNWYKGQLNEDWYVTVACDTKSLNTSSFFVDALERHIRRIIKNPLAKIIFKLEQVGAIDSFFIEDSLTTERRNLWCASKDNEKLFSYSIEDKQIKDASGPECYQCETPDLELRLPFSRIIFESIEETKSLFADEVKRSKLKCELEVEDHLPDEILHEICLQQESFILKKISDIFEAERITAPLMKDYITDFCNLYSYTFSNVLEKESRIEYMRWTLEQRGDINVLDNVHLLTNIHCLGWSHVNLFDSIIQLFELCSNVFKGGSNIFVQFQNHLLSKDNKHDSSEKSEFLFENFETEEINTALINELHTHEKTVEDSNVQFDTDHHTIAKGEISDECVNIDLDGSNICAEDHVLYGRIGQDKLFKPSLDLEHPEENPKEYTNVAVTKVDDMKENENDELFQDDSNTSYETEQSNLDSDQAQANCLSTDNIQGFVSFVCTRLLPTKECMSEFSGIKNWQLTVKNILIVTAEVSTDSEALHSLRLCNDIVTDIVLPYNLGLEPLHGIGESLVCGSVDSESVFSNLLNLFKYLKETESAAPIQRVICQFLMRCLSNNTETKAFIYLFTAIEEGVLPEGDMHLLKTPVKYLIQNELDENENENIFMDLATSAENRDALLESSLFLNTLDRCLHVLNEQDRIASPFVLLIIDLIQDTYEQDESISNTEDKLILAGQILQENNIGLAFISAVAYSKAAISLITEAEISSSDQPEIIKNLLTAFNAVLCGLNDSNIDKPMLEYFLTVIGKDSSIYNVRNYCRSLSDNWSFLEKINWSDDYLSNSLENNPLAIEIDDKLLHEGEGFVAKEQSTEAFKKSMSKLIQIALKQPVSGLLLLYTLTMKKWYMSRQRKSLDDKDRMHAALLMEETKLLKLPPEQYNLVECLVGKRDFVCKFFMHGEESKFQQCMINSILVSTFARLLAFCNDSNDGSSLLGLCLLNPKEVKGYMFSESVQLIGQRKNIYFQDNGKFALCKCNRRLFFKSSSGTSYACPVCGNEPVIDNVQISSKQLTLNPIHQTAMCSTFSFQMRTLSDVALCTLQFLVNGCLLGSIALEISKHSEIEGVLGNQCPEIDVCHQLESNILNNWEELKIFLNMDDHDVGILMHSLLHKGKQLIFEEKYSTLSESQKIKWESKFDDLVSEILDKRAVTIQHTLYQCNNLYNLPKQCVESAMREANDFENTEQTERYEEFSTLFRKPVKPSREDFQTQLCFTRDKFPFLIMFLRKEDEFNLPKHIYNIVQWHVVTVVNISYVFKRTECLKLTVGEFHSKISDLKKQKMSKQIFEKFKNSWNALKDLLKDTEGFQTTMSVSIKTRMAECLVLDTTCDIYKVLSYLVNIQNGLIDMALTHSFACNNLQFLLRDDDTACCKAVPVTELKSVHLIEKTFDLDESLAQESNSGLAYGLGKQIFYDFENIEKELCVDLLSGKAYVTLEELPRIVFTDELYKNFVALLEEVCHSIPQEALPVDLEEAFVKSNHDMANMSVELINYLDMVLTLLKQSKYDPKKSLIDFAHERANIVGQQFPTQYLPTPDSGVKLCHIISLHELLEELSVNRIIGSLVETELDADMNEHFSKMPETSIRKSEIVLKVLKRFVYRCVFMGEIDSEQQVLQYLSQKSFWPSHIFQNEKLIIDGNEEDVKDVIPPTLLVCHIVAAVSTLSESIEAQKQGEVRMDRVIASWKGKSKENVAKVTRQKKAVKKLRKS